MAWGVPPGDLPTSPGSHPARARWDKERRSALQEAQLLQSLTHPNVVAYVDMHATRSKLFLFMQYCDGGDLEQRINGHKKAGTHVTETQLLDWFVQMALALQYLHDSRSAHTVPQPSRPTLAPLAFRRHPFLPI